MLHSRRSLLALAALTLAGAPVIAQVFPSRPIRLIVPFPPASAPDILARLVAESAGARLQQPIVVENKPGAGGLIGTSAAAKSAPDGYTLLMGDTGPLAIAPWLYSKMPYAPTKELTGVASLVSVPLVMIVPRSATINSVSDLMTQARARPEQLLYGSLGVGSIHHLAAEVFAAAAGIKLTHVPYKGNAELAQGIVNGDVQMAFSSIPAVEAFIKEDRMRAIAISTSRRLPQHSEVRTVQEQGVAGYDVSPTIGIVAPSGVPTDRLKVLEEAFLAALAEPKLAGRLETLGMVRRPASGAAYQAAIESELERYRQMVKTAGVLPQ